MPPARWMPTQHWFCVTSHPLANCCTPTIHPHFHLYPIFHFISMLISGVGAVGVGGRTSLCHVIYSDAAA